MDAQSAFSDLNNNTLESIQGVRVIRAFVQENQDTERFKEQAEDVFQRNILVAKLDALLNQRSKYWSVFLIRLGLVMELFCHAKCHNYRRTSHV